MSPKLILVALLECCVSKSRALTLAGHQQEVQRDQKAQDHGVLSLRGNSTSVTVVESSNTPPIPPEADLGDDAERAREYERLPPPELGVRRSRVALATTVGAVVLGGVVAGVLTFGVGALLVGGVVAVVGASAGGAVVGGCVGGLAGHKREKTKAWTQQQHYKQALDSLEAKGFVLDEAGRASLSSLNPAQWRELLSVDNRGDRSKWSNITKENKKKIREVMVLLVAQGIGFDELKATRRRLYDAWKKGQLDFVIGCLAVEHGVCSVGQWMKDFSRVIESESFGRQQTMPEYIYHGFRTLQVMRRVKVPGYQWTKEDIMEMTGWWNSSEIKTYQEKINLLDDLFDRHVEEWEMGASDKEEIRARYKEAKDLDERLQVFEDGLKLAQDFARLAYDIDLSDLPAASRQPAAGVAELTRHAPNLLARIMESEGARQLVDKGDIKGAIVQALSEGLQSANWPVPQQACYQIADAVDLLVRRDVPADRPPTKEVGRARLQLKNALAALQPVGQQHHDPPHGLEDRTPAVIKDIKADLLAKPGGRQNQRGLALRDEAYRGLEDKNEVLVFNQQAFARFNAITADWWENLMYIPPTLALDDKLQSAIREAICMMAFVYSPEEVEKQKNLLLARSKKLMRRRIDECKRRCSALALRNQAYQGLQNKGLVLNKRGLDRFNAVTDDQWANLMKLPPNLTDEQQLALCEAICLGTSVSTLEEVSKVKDLLRADLEQGVPLKHYVWPVKIPFIRQQLKLSVEAHGGDESAESLALRQLVRAHSDMFLDPDFLDSDPLSKAAEDGAFGLEVALAVLDRIGASLERSGVGDEVYVITEQDRRELQRAMRVQIEDQHRAEQDVAPNDHDRDPLRDYVGRPYTPQIRERLINDLYRHFKLTGTSEPSGNPAPPTPEEQIQLLRVECKRKFDQRSSAMVKDILQNHDEDDLVTEVLAPPVIERNNKIEVRDGGANLNEARRKVQAIEDQLQPLISNRLTISVDDYPRDKRNNFLDAIAVIQEADEEGTLALSEHDRNLMQDVFQLGPKPTMTEMQRVFDQVDRALKDWDGQTVPITVPQALKVVAGGPDRSVDKTNNETGIVEEEYGGADPSANADGAR
ncbi:MAG: hypothetical protein AAF637_00260 [Pseudomonadota bacterium]